MTNLFGKKNTDIFPPKQAATVAGLSVLNSLEKLAVVEEANNLGDRVARNFEDLDLSGSIYEED